MTKEKAILFIHEVFEVPYKVVEQAIDVPETTEVLFTMKGLENKSMSNHVSLCDFIKYLEKL